MSENKTQPTQPMDENLVRFIHAVTAEMHTLVIMKRSGSVMISAQIHDGVLADAEIENNLKLEINED